MRPGASARGNMMQLDCNWNVPSEERPFAHERPTSQQSFDDALQTSCWAKSKILSSGLLAADHVAIYCIRSRVTELFEIQRILPSKYVPFIPMTCERENPSSPYDISYINPNVPGDIAVHACVYTYIYIYVCVCVYIYIYTVYIYIYTCMNSYSICTLAIMYHDE